MERKNILLILAIVLIAAGIFVVKRYLGGSSDCQKLSYSISAKSVLVGESIHFEDNSPDANDWKWDFGDGGKSELQNGDYTYNTAGDYVITLIVNGKCTETASIKVNELTISSADTTQKQVVIMGPPTCYVGEKVQFGNNTDGAANWEWMFGESGTTDSKDQNPSYTYDKPGVYTVVLRVDNSKSEGRHKINVITKPAATGAGAPKPEKISEAQLKAKFESILQGNFSDVYYDMLKKYFCNNDHVTVEINGDKTKGIYSYCMQLDIQRNTKIADVKITYDSNCISKVSVTHK